MKCLISSCLYGFNCRYNGSDARLKNMDELKEKIEFVPVCPEVFGRLGTPRESVEIVNGVCLTESGEDVTSAYIEGAHMTLDLAIGNDCKIALFKSKSPSCGKGCIYDGTFTSKLIEGNGICTQLLLDNGIKVFSDEEIDEFLIEMEKKA